MKKRTRVICIFTVLIMVLTMSGTGVFAAEGAGEATDVNAPADQAVTDVTEAEVQAAAGETAGYEQALEEMGIDESMDVIQDTAPAEEEVIPTEAAAEAAEPSAAETKLQEKEEATEADRSPALTQKSLKVKSLAKVKNLKGVAGFYAVKLSWSKVKNANYYIVERCHTGKNNWVRMKSVKTTGYTDTLVGMYKKYTYRVTAVRNSEGVTIKSKPAYLNKDCVAKMRIYITFKRGKTYTNPNGSKFRYGAGTRIVSDGYGGGRYKFRVNGKTHSVARAAVRNPQAVYARPNAKNNNNYTPAAAEFFINRYVKMNGINSGKRYLIWVSTYCQHLYVFKKSGGQWKYDRSWEVSTGKASTPSPTGNKNIHKKLRTRHSIGYWSCYSSLNALHGVRNSSWVGKLGRIASGGCIRNKNIQAKWIYKNCANGTRVIVY